MHNLSVVDGPLRLLAVCCVADNPPKKNFVAGHWVLPEDEKKKDNQNIMHTDMQKKIIIIKGD
jgi:hypothetical protein